MAKRLTQTIHAAVTAVVSNFGNNCTCSRQCSATTLNIERDGETTHNTDTSRSIAPNKKRSAKALVRIGKGKSLSQLDQLVIIVRLD